MKHAMSACRREYFSAAPAIIWTRGLWSGVIISEKVSFPEHAHALALSDPFALAEYALDLAHYCGLLECNNHVLAFFLDELTRLLCDCLLII
jgi:hypothetical protein